MGFWVKPIETDPDDKTNQIFERQKKYLVKDENLGLWRK